MNWVLCHQPATLEEAITLMEAYTSAEAGLYLMPCSWKKGGTKSSRGQGPPPNAPHKRRRLIMEKRGCGGSPGRHDSPIIYAKTLHTKHVIEVL